MATSSFMKTFVFNAEATQKIRRCCEQPGIRVAASTKNRLKDGRAALVQFSSLLKK